MHCARRDFVEGYGGGIDGGTVRDRTARAIAGWISSRRSEDIRGEAEDGGDSRGGELHFGWFKKKN